jgi:bifunctional enzyme CysN/CysC
MDVPKLLADNERKELLRFVTAGSVDDGKSTLIGRLLFESKGLYEDQLAAVESASKLVGSTGGGLDLALVTDGLKSEREQGITIDVAYRYFSTPKRKFIIADTPGHEQYTRNMVTGASTADMMVILIDASAGLLVQSKRHAFIASLLDIPHLLVAVNKMDLVDYSQEVYDRIVSDFKEFAARLQIPDIRFIPVSALENENVVNHGQAMPWCDGPHLLHELENVHVTGARNPIDLRFPVQFAHRPDRTFRGYLGSVASGTIRPGDEVTVLPSGVTSKVARVLGPNGDVEAAHPPLAVSVVLEDEIDVSRGDMIVHSRNRPRVDRNFEAMLVWMSPEPMKPGTPYYIKQTTRVQPGTVAELQYRIDVNTLHRQDATQLGLNEIGRCSVSLNHAIAHDTYRKNHATGSFIVIDRVTNNTVGAGMIIDRGKDASSEPTSHWEQEPPSEFLHEELSQVRLSERSNRQGHRPATILLTGLTGAGKSTIAYGLERRLFDAGCAVNVLDGQNVRLGISRDLGFTKEGRSENLRRAAELAHLFNEAGQICICAFVAPQQETRERAMQLVGTDRFLEVYLSAPIEVCRERDPDGFYVKVDAGEITHVPGVTEPYEPPQNPDLILPTDHVALDVCLDRIIELLRDRGVLDPE